MKDDGPESIVEVWTKSKYRVPTAIETASAAGFAGGAAASIVKQMQAPGALTALASYTAVAAEITKSVMEIYGTYDTLAARLADVAIDYGAIARNLAPAFAALAQQQQAIVDQFAQTISVATLLGASVVVLPDEDREPEPVADRFARGREIPLLVAPYIVVALVYLWLAVAAANAARQEATTPEVQDQLGIYAGAAMGIYGLMLAEASWRTARQ